MPVACACLIRAVEGHEAPRGAAGCKTQCIYEIRALTVPGQGMTDQRFVLTPYIWQ